VALKEKQPKVDENGNKQQNENESESNIPSTGVKNAF
jgi:hypothetical protein